MFFILKKILILFFFPLTISTMLMFFGLFFLWFSKKQKTGKYLLTIAFLLTIFFSYGIMTDKIIRFYESSFTRFEDIEMGKFKNIKWVVVLGGGISSDSLVPITSQLNWSTLSRVIEGIRVYKKIQNAKLIFSGGKAFNDVAEAYLMRNFAIELGVNEKDIYIEEESKDTKDQAMLIKKIIHDDSFCLVTSAYHMHRSLYLFKEQNLYPIPVPTDFLIKDNKRMTFDSYFPSSLRIWKAEKIIKEFLGISFEKIKNTI